MQLFAVALGAPGTAAPDVEDAVRTAAAPFEQLAGAPVHVGRSPTGAVAYAHVHDDDPVAGPRRYAAARGDVRVLFDGFPVEREGRFDAHDAGALLDHWDAAFGELEGLFTAVRLDLAGDAVECYMDVLGMAPLYAHEAGGVTLLANSVEAIRVAGGLTEPDELGVASMLSLGWPLGGRSLLAGVRQLPGGAAHAFTPGAGRSRVFLSPATILGARPPSIGEVGERMRTSARVVARAGAPVHSALSSGRDTRLLLSLLLAEGIDAAYYTSGIGDDPDIVIGGKLARRWGLRHTVLPQEAPADEATWAAETESFIRRNDGLASLESINDHLDHHGPPDQLAVEFWGAGGEIGRTPWGWITQPLGGIAPGLRRSWAVQRWIVTRALSTHEGQLHQAAVDPLCAYLDDFFAERRAEGWPPSAGFGLYYAFGRVRWWASRGVRRASPTADLYGPFLTRSYIEHSLRITPGERWTEQPHRQLISAFWPDADQVPYEVPWRPQVPRAALPLHVAETGWFALRDRLRREPDPHGPAFGPIWIEAGLARHRRLAEAVPDSPVWRFADRSRHLALLAGPAEARASAGHMLTRVLTLLWYFHGPGGPRPAV